MPYPTKQKKKGANKENKLKKTQNLTKKVPNQPTISDLMNSEQSNVEVPMEATSKASKRPASDFHDSTSPTTASPIPKQRILNDTESGKSQDPASLPLNESPIPKSNSEQITTESEASKSNVIKNPIDESPIQEKTPEQLISALSDQAQQDVFSLLFQKLSKIEDDVKPVKRINVIARQANANTDRITKVEVSARANSNQIQEASNDLQQLRETVQEQVLPALKEIKAEQLHTEGLLASEKTKANIIIGGLDEKPGEDLEHRITNWLQVVLGLTGIHIAYIARMGKPKLNSKRSIMVKITNPLDRKRIWGARSKLKETPENRQYSVRMDVPVQFRYMNKYLYMVKEAANKGAKSKNKTYARVFDYKLIIGGRAYRPDQLENLPYGLRPSSLCTPRNDDAIIFFGLPSPLSMHHHAPFILEGQWFQNMEQYWAYKKLYTLGRNEEAEEIRADPSPFESRKKLNEIREACAKMPAWTEKAKTVLQEGLLAKFSQNPKLKQFLLETGDRKVGEASTDAFWGTGLRIGQENDLDHTFWTGQNTLGVQLMELRDWFRGIPTSEFHVYGPA